MMHPVMALWIFSLSMGRVWQESLWQSMGVPETDHPHTSEIPTPPRLILANDYLRSELAVAPLPNRILDQLAELYWTERDSELAI